MRNMCALPFMLLVLVCGCSFGRTEAYRVVESAPAKGGAVGCGDLMDRGLIRSILSAIDGGDVKRLRKLIESGADLNCLLGESEGVSASYGPPLVYAISSRNIPLIELMLEMGANPNFTFNAWNSGYKSTPLSSAAELNQYQIFYLMAQYGGDLSYIDDFGHGFDEYFYRARVITDSDHYQWLMKSIELYEERTGNVVDRSKMFSR